VTVTLTGDNDQPLVVLKDKPISDPKVDDVLTGLMQLKEICVDIEQRKLKMEQLENNLDALKNRILNTKIHQVSSDTINQPLAIHLHELNNFFNRTHHGSRSWQHLHL
jgi:hypothetical protein